MEQLLAEPPIATGGHNTTEFLVTYRDYELAANSVMFRLFGRDVQGNRIIKHVSGIKPYLYIRSDVPIVPDHRIVSVVNPSPVPSLFGEELQQIFTQKPSDVAGRKEDVTYIKDMYDFTYEADVLFDYRGGIDYDLNGVVSCPNKLFVPVDQIQMVDESKVVPITTRKFIFDIENKDDGTIEQAKQGKKDIYVITIYDSLTDTYYIFCAYQLSPYDEAEIKAIIRNHWKDNKYYPDYAESKLDFRYFSNETMMLEGVLAFVEMNPPDILSGFNSNGYDIPTFCNRCKELRIDYKRLSEVRNVYPNRPMISGVACMDLQDLYQEYQQGTVMYPSLNYVSGVELETAKLPRKSIIELYQTDRVTLTAYNIIDVQLTVAINEKNNLINYFNEISITSYASFEDHNRSTFIDNILLKEVSGEMILPTRPKQDPNAPKKKKMRGGIVYKSTPGVHHNVIVLDFAGMYPSIIIALNISRETKDPNGDVVAANGIRFKSSPIGIVPRVLKRLKIKRKTYKKLKADAEAQGQREKVKTGQLTPITAALIQQYDLKQYAIKVLMNAFYGVMGFSRFRLADTEMGDAITSTGQKLSTSCKNFIETTTVMFEGKPIEIEAIYGDTDSIFIKVLTEGFNPLQLKEIAEIMAKSVNEEIDRLMNELFNVTDHDVEIEVDKIFKTLFQVPAKTGEGAKKRYAGHIYEFNEIGEYIGVKDVIKGFEAVKANSSKLTKDVQKHLLFNLILKDAPKSEIRAYLNEIKAQFYDDKIDTRDLSMRAPLKKEIKLYGNKPEINGIRNAIMYLKRDIDVGYVGAFYQLSKSPGNLPSHSVIVLDFDEELPEGYIINHKETWSKLVHKPVETILLAYETSWDYVKTGKTTKKALGFFTAPAPTPVPKPKPTPMICKRMDFDGIPYELIKTTIHLGEKEEQELMLKAEFTQYKTFKINKLWLIYASLEQRDEDEPPAIEIQPTGALYKFFKR